MINTKILKNIFELKRMGIEVDIESLPSEINREVVTKNFLQIELELLKQNGGSQDRILEINNILNPSNEGEEG